MKEIDVINQVVNRLTKEYAYSSENIVYGNNNNSCDVIVNYPGTDKPFIIVEVKDLSYDENILLARANIQSLLLYKESAPIYVMVADAFSKQCYLVDQTSTSILKRVDDIPVNYGTNYKLKKGVDEKVVLSTFNSIYESLWIDGSMQQLKAFDEVNKLILCFLYNEKVLGEVKKANTLVDFLEIAEGDIDQYKISLRDKINALFERAKDAFPRIFNDEIVLDKNKLFYAMASLQNLCISDEQSRDIVSKGYSLFVARVLGEGKVNKCVLDFIVQFIQLENKKTMLLPYGSGVLQSLLVDNNKESKNNIYGVDINQRHIQVSKIKLILANGDPCLVEKGDGISDKYSDLNGDKIQKMTYDLIISIPPTDQQVKADSILSNEYELFRKGVGFDVKDVDKKGLRASQSIEVLFLERCYHTLRDNGTLAIILPDTLLSNKNLQYVRDWLVTHFMVKAIVSLPKDSVKTKQRITKSSYLVLTKISNEIVEKQKNLLEEIRQQLLISKMSKADYSNNLLNEYSRRITEIVPEYSVELFDVTACNKKEFDKVLMRMKL